MTSRLPITIRPAADEIAVSYLTRLAALHGMPFTELWTQASRPRGTNKTSRTLDGELLATLTDQPRSRLAHALIELRHPEPDWLALRHEPQRGCWRCNARHPGGPVLQLLPHHRYVCTRHHVWIGPPDQVEHPQPVLVALPEIVAAQHAHLRLLRRLGPAATFDAVLTGFLICAHRWNVTDPAPAGDARHEWHRRATRLISPDTELDTFSASRLFAATYPEAISVAALIGALQWRRLAAGDPDAQRRFAAEIGRRLGQPDYMPRLINDPIAHWIEQDCWQPPSLPDHDYRSLRTFGGSTFRTPNPRSAEIRETSAYYYGIHHRGGDAMLHHRTLAPVVIRDWSERMELFVGALHVSASTGRDTRRNRNADDHTDPADATFVRPHAAPSPYLDTAVEPVDWPHRSGPRPPRGGRPYLPNERPKQLRRRRTPQSAK
jgi:hypothetical protein